MMNMAEMFILYIFLASMVLLTGLGAYKQLSALTATWFKLARQLLGSTSSGQASSA
jgi:hypothetical protein